MSTLADFLPWQREYATNWLSDRERFAHAWLIHGLAGIGKRTFALAAAASLLCEKPHNAMACGACLACGWLASGNHPDFRRVRPEAVAQEEGDVPEEGGATQKTPSKEIRVEQIRALSGWFNTATHRGGWRVAVVYPAQAMNHITANALLKVLEEPPPRTVFLLSTDAPDLLLPTIVSRCRRLPLSVPPFAEAADWLQDQGLQNPEEWLAAAGGAPLRALKLSQTAEAPCPPWLQRFLTELAQDPAPNDAWMAAADALDGLEAAIWIDALQRAFVDFSLVAAGAPARYFPAQLPAMKKIAARSDSAQLSETMKWLSRQRTVAGHPLSPKLFVQSVLQRCAIACGSASGREKA